MFSEVLAFPVTAFRSSQCWFPVVVAGLNASGETHTPPSLPTKTPRSWAPAPTAKSKACTSTWVDVLFPLPSALKSCQVPAAVRGAINRRSAERRAGEMGLGSATGENNRSRAAGNDGELHGVIAKRLAEIGKIRGVGIDRAERRSGAAAEDAAARKNGEQIIRSGGGIGDGYEESGIRGRRARCDGQGNSSVGTGVLAGIDAGDSFPRLAQIHRDVHAVAWFYRARSGTGGGIACGITQRGVDGVAGGIAGIKDNIGRGIERRAGGRNATGLNADPVRAAIGRAINSGQQRTARGKIGALHRGEDDGIGFVRLNGERGNVRAAGEDALRRGFGERRILLPGMAAIGRTQHSRAIDIVLREIRFAGAHQNQGALRMAAKTSARRGIHGNRSGGQGRLSVGKRLPGYRCARQRIETDPHATVSGSGIDGVAGRIARIGGQRGDTSRDVSVELRRRGGLRAQRRPHIELRNDRGVRRNARLQKCPVVLNHFFILGEGVEQQLAREYGRFGWRADEKTTRRVAGSIRRFAGSAAFWV